MLVVECRGHPNVQLLHENTLEAVMEDRLTPRGDCILCVAARYRMEGECRGLARGFIVVFNPHGGVGFASFTGVAGDCAKLVIRRTSVCKDSIVCRATIAARDLKRLRRLLSSPFTRVYLVVFYYDVQATLIA